MSDAGDEQDDEVDEAPGVEEWIADESRAEEVPTAPRGLCPRSSAARAWLVSRRSGTRPDWRLPGTVTGRPLAYR
jgi:hypothetical protein